MNIPKIYNDPVVARKRNGTTGDPFRQISETLTVNRNYVLLTEVPNRFNRVQVKDYYEVTDGELAKDQFKVDYVNGIVFFHESMQGIALTFTYLGEGVLLFPDSRIYVSGYRSDWTLNDKLLDVDRLIEEQKNRVDVLIRETPQPDEILDVRTDRNGKVYPVARDRVNAIQEVVEDAFKDINGKKYTTLKDRIDADQQMVQDAFLSTDKEALFDNLDSRLTYDYETLDALLTAKLNKEVEILNKRIDRQTFVSDFGAKGDGKTDDSEAFKQAIGDGNVRVFISPGTYIVRGVKLPSNTQLIGAGKDVTILKLHDDTPAEERVIANRDYLEGGNEYVYVEGMTLDGNQQRQGGLNTQSGSRGSGLMYAGVKFGWAKDVKSVNALLHGFDITCLGDTYPYDGDGTVAEGRSQYVWFENLEAYNFSDDGITTHHSDFMFISNCHNEAPRTTGNKNGIEIDDGSRHAILINNSSRDCFGGLEIKAHRTASAAQNVHVIGYISVGDVRSFNFRHVGHHKASHEETKTAHDITATNLISLYPKRNKVRNWEPRALVISAYKNVSISNFTAIGNSDYDGSSVVALQYRCRNISLSNINIRGFVNATYDIRLVGGAQRTNNVNINGVNVYKSAKRGIMSGSGIFNANISNATLVGDKGTIGFYSSNNQLNVNSIHTEGYTNAAKIGGNTYKDFVPNNFKGGARIATTSGYAKSSTGAIIASTADPVADGSKSVVMASSAGKAHGESSAVIATSGSSTTHGIRNAVIASSGGSSTNGSRALVGSSNNSRIEGTGSVARTILSSNGVVNNTSYTVVGGYGTSRSTSNKKWELHSTRGTIKATGAITGSSTFSDYAEYFESVDGIKIPTGTIVTLDGDKVRIADKGDDMLGVISETAGAILGEASFYWKDRYLRNEFGGLIYEETTDSKGRKMTLPVENPEYNEDMSYEPRTDRDEWNVVGLLGQIYIKCDKTVSIGDNIEAKNGVATKSDSGWKVMKMTTSYNAKKGYGVALCFVR